MHTVILPHALAYNAGQAPDAMQAIARAFGASSGKSAATLVFDLAVANDAPVALKDIGMPADGLDHAADLAVQNRYPNPRPLERAALRELLQRAFEGARPG